MKQVPLHTLGRTNRTEVMNSRVPPSIYDERWTDSALAAREAAEQIKFAIDQRAVGSQLTAIYE